MTSSNLTAEEWRILEALRSPETEPHGPTSDAADIAYVIHCDVGADPTKAQVQAIDRVLRSLEKRGLVYGVASERRRYVINSMGEAAVDGRSGAPTELADWAMGERILETACSVLDKLYPGLAAGDALDKWLEEKERQVN